jgi:Na+/H+ antiporter NhaD/arsenite permease-like protein
LRSDGTDSRLLLLMTRSSDLPAIIAALTLAAVIAAIALNWLDLAVAALLGAVLLRVLGIVSQETAVSSINVGYDTIALFFGGMVVARALVPTGIFDYLGARVLRLVRGDGRLLLVSIVVLTAPICAILPNATVVILFAPLLIRVCRTMEIDFVPSIMRLVFVANASGLLTLVGDPATFIVGNSIRMDFTSYLKRGELDSVRRREAGEVRPCRQFDCMPLLLEPRGERDEGLSIAHRADGQ